MRKVIFYDIYLFCAYLCLIIGLVLVEVYASNYFWLKYLYLMVSVVFSICILGIHKTNIENNFLSIASGVLTAIVLLLSGMILGVNFKLLIGGTL